MPSASPSKFKGASGILRDVDGVITSLQFTDKNPLAGTGTPKPGQKKSDFHSLFAVVGVQADGATAPSPQPIFVGDADAFGITEDGMGLTGDGEVSKSSGWFVFLDSLVKAGFDDSVFPSDDPTTADWAAIVGARVRFNWQVNEKATKKYGKKEGKAIDPKTGKKKVYDREDLIVTNYYGQQDVAATTPGKPAAGAKAAGGAKTGVKAGAKAKVDIPALAAENVIKALSAAKDHTMSKSKLSVKLLTLLNTADEQTRNAVQAWAFVDENIGAIDGVNYDAETAMLSLITEETD